MQTKPPYASVSAEREAAKSKKDFSWELGVSKLLTGYCLPQWLCLGKKKSPLLFLSLLSPPTSSSWGTRAQNCLLGAQGVTLSGKCLKGHTVILSFQPYGNTSIGDDGGGKKPRLDQEQQLISIDFLTQTHRTAVKEKIPLIYLLPLCEMKLRHFKAADKKPLRLLIFLINPRPVSAASYITFQM